MGGNELGGENEEEQYMTVKIKAGRLKRPFLDCSSSIVVYI